MFQERVRENYPDLTPGFRKLADFIMTNTLDAAFLTTAELSRKVGVDPTTIVRFAQEIGYAGYRELAWDIRTYVRNQLAENHRQATAEETEEAFVRRLFEIDHENLEAFIATGHLDLAEAVRILRESSHIWIAGEFTCYPLALFLAESLSATGIPATAFRPGVLESAHNLTVMQPGDALLAIAIRNPGVDAGYVMRLAREKGVQTIAIIDCESVLPAREASLTLMIPGTNLLSGISYGPVMSLIALIYEAVAGKKPDGTAQAFTAYYECRGELLSLRAIQPITVLG